MTSSPEELIRRAGEALNRDDYVQALVLLDEGLQELPDRSEAYILKGICHAQLGHTEDASEAFRRAIHLAPQSFKAHYNYATHLYQLGEMDAARVSCARALEIMPGHAAARDLYAHILECEPEGATPLPIEEVIMGSSVLHLKEAPYQSAPLPPPDHTIPFIEKLGPLWPAIAWAIALVSASQIAMLVAKIAHAISNPVASRGPQGWGEFILGLIFDPAYRTNQTIGLVCFIATAIWSVLDILDRTGRDYSWVIALVITSIPIFGWTGMEWLLLPLFLLFGRRRDE